MLQHKLHVENSKHIVIYRQENTGFSSNALKSITPTDVVVVNLGHHIDPGKAARINLLGGKNTLES